MVSITHIRKFSDSTYQGIRKYSLGSEASKKLKLLRKTNVFSKMALKKKLAKQAKENLYWKIIHEGYAPSSILYSIDYEKGTLQMDIMKPKVNK